MKKCIYILLIVITGMWAYGTEAPVVEKRKAYSKSYTVSDNDKIAISNSFGEMRFNTWNKKEVKVDITIIVRAGTDQKADEIMEKIRIEDAKSSGEVSFKTKVDNVNFNGNQNKDKSYKEEGMEINYVVYLPEKARLDAANSFGAMIIGDYTGEVSLQSKFGSLKAGNLSNVKQVHVEFGKADITAVNNGKVTIKFSKASVGKFSGDITSNFEFCDAIDLALDQSLTALNVKSSYSTLQIGLSKDFSANFEIKTSFGEVDNDGNFPIKEKDDGKKNNGPRFDKSYSGITGKGTAKVTIKSEFGKVKLL